MERQAQLGKLTDMKDECVSAEFEKSIASITGLCVNHIWRGYGSAIFLEIGSLLPGRIRRDGTPGNPIGEFTVCIEWSWRIEGKRRIWCGSWTEEEKWPKTFARLTGSLVESVSLFGRIPEIDVGFSNGLHLLSMMTAEGDPEWGLIDRISSVSFDIRAGRLKIDRRVQAKGRWPTSDNI
jgi:hypothetical protein